MSVSRITNPRDILLKPVISEKSYRLADEGKYTFLVAPEANKTQIRQAVEACATSSEDTATPASDLSFASLPPTSPQSFETDREVIEI